MDVLRLKIMARKSIYAWGRDTTKGLSIQQLLDSRRQKVIISSYFGLDRVSYLDDILDEVGITPDLRIDKPGKLRGKEHRAAMRAAMRNFYGRLPDTQKMAASQRAKKGRKKKAQRELMRLGLTGSKIALRDKNQGH